MDAVGQGHEARAVLAVLGEPMRARLLERLLDEPSTATELAGQVAVTRSAVSQHLQVMKAVGLVADEPSGTRRVYRVQPDALALLATYFTSFWTRALGDLSEAAERASGDPDRPRPRPSGHPRGDGS